MAALVDNGIEHCHCCDDALRRDLRAVCPHESLRNGRADGVSHAGNLFRLAVPLADVRLDVDDVVGRKALCEHELTRFEHSHSDVGDEVPFAVNLHDENFVGGYRIACVLVQNFADVRPIPEVLRRVYFLQIRFDDIVPRQRRYRRQRTVNAGRMVCAAVVMQQICRHKVLVALCRKRRSRLINHFPLPSCPFPCLLIKCTATTAL